MEKKYLFLIMLLLTVGFASANTILDLNGKVDMSLLESDLDVVFKEVLLNNNKSANTIIIEDGKSFLYTVEDLNKDNTTSTIDYVVMNRSHQYDVEVTVSCTTDYKDNISYNGTFDNNKLPLEKGILIEAGEVKSGNIITELIKESTSEESLVLKCSLNYIPVSREEIVEDEEYIVTLDSGYEEKISDIKVRYYEEYGKLPELTRSNYQFLGWYTEEDIKVDNNSLVKIKGNHTLKAKWNRLCEYDPGKVWNFNYTGGQQTFTVPCDGEYKIELWGASGGKNAYGGVGGKGAYTSGNINFHLDQKIYVYVGGQGQNSTSTTPSASLIRGGFNGGGSNGSKDYRSSGGGGATDVRLINGAWNNSDGLKSRIMVAGAGGGGGISNSGAYGNMTANKWNSLYGGNGTQTSGGAVGTGYTHNSQATAGGFGYGGNGGYYVVGAGGSGYYGGAGGQHITPQTSGGGGSGSSFVSGHAGCNAINTSGVHTGQPNHYSGFVFTNTIMIAGNASMSTYDGKSTMIGNSGNGYAKITLVSVD